MKILIIGASEGGHILSQYLLEDNEVNCVYHIGSFANFSNERYYGFRLNSNLEKEKEEIRALTLNVIETKEIDLVINLQLIFLLWDKLYELVKSKNIPYLGPSPKLSLFEYLKTSSKQLLKSIEVPTPNYIECSYDYLLENFFKINRPFVFKYDKIDLLGLQTVVVRDINVHEEYDTLLENKNKDVKFVVEDYLEIHREYSYHAIVNNINWQYLGSARDYKKIHENDKGYNTSGLGAYAPVNINPLVHEFAKKIISSLEGYTGILYLGIAEDKNGNPYVLEINTRFGNPELQVILPLIENNLKDLFYCAATEKEIPAIYFKNKAAVAIRIFHKQYRKSYQDKLIFLPDFFNRNNDIFIGYAGANSNNIHS